MKKKLFSIMALLGLVMTSLFISPIVSHAEENIEESGIQALSNTKDLGGVQASPYKTIDLTYEEFATDGDSIYELGIRISNSEFINYASSLFNFQTSYGPIVTNSDDYEVLFVECDTYTQLNVYFYNEITNVEGVEPEPGFYYLFDDFDIIVYLKSAEDTQIFDQAWCEIYRLYDVTAPVIGGTVNISVNVDSQPSVDELLSHVYALDETDGRVPVIATSSTYTPGEIQVGTYQINISASDNSGNTSTGVITVHRFDGTVPILTTSQAEYVVNYDNTLNLDSIKATLTVHDNVDNNCTIIVENDTFTGHEHVVGDYSIQFRAKDASNNYSTVLNIPISVKNLGTPVITGPKKIVAGTTEKLTLEDFKSHYTSTDGYDGELNFSISGFDEFLKNAKKIGNYTVNISTTNSGNKSASMTVTIEVKDDKAPGIFYDKNFILLKQGETFTRQMALEHVAHVLQVEVSDILELNGVYDTMTVGNYDLEVCLVSGEIEDFVLSVYNDEEKKPQQEGFDFNKFFSGEGYAENFFNYPNWQNWNVWIWFTYAMIAIVVLVTVYFKFLRKKSSGKRR